MATSDWEIGQVLVMTENDECFHEGDLVKLVNTDTDGTVLVNGLTPPRLVEEIWVSEECVETLSERNNMSDQKVTAKQIRESALSVEDQLLLDNDIVNAEGALTENGEGVVLQVLFTANKDAVVAAVKAIADAQKATATK